MNNPINKPANNAANNAANNEANHVANNSKARKSLVLPLIAGTLALVVGSWTGMQLLNPPAAPQPEMTTVTLLSAPRPLPELALVDEDGEPFGRTTFAGNWSLVFLGFTNCGHVCPMTMTKLRIIRDGLEQPVNVVFVSVDPGRDTPEVIKAYVDGFDENFTGITGASGELDKLANTLGAPWFVDNSGDRYIVDHSSALFLIDSNASFAGVITQPLEIDQIISELNRIL